MYVIEKAIMTIKTTPEISLKNDFNFYFIKNLYYNIFFYRLNKIKIFFIHIIETQIID